MSLTKAHNRMIDSSSANVKDFGAVGDGIADDTVAIQAALNSGAKTVITEDCSELKTTATITVPDHVDFIQSCKIVYTGSNSQPALIVGTNSYATTGDNFYRKHRLGVEYKPDGVSLADKWSNTSSIAIKFNRVLHSSIEIFVASYAYAGIQIDALFAYNFVQLGNHRDNKIGLHITSTEYSAENIFSGGDFAHESPYAAAGLGDRYAVYAEDTGTNNVFDKPSIHLKTSGYFFVTTGTQNTFRGIRAENLDPYTGLKLAYEKRGAGQAANSYEVSYAALIRPNLRVEYQSEDMLYFSTVTYPNLGIYANWVSVLNRRAIGRDAVEYNAGNTMIAGLALTTSSGTESLFYNSVDINEDYVTLTAFNVGVQFFVDTTTQKVFNIITYDEDGNPANSTINVKCYDASGSLVTSKSEFPNQNFSYVTSTVFGDSFKRSSQADDFQFMVGDTVEKIAIIISGNNLNLSGFHLLTRIDGSAEGYGARFADVRAWTSFDNVYGNVDKGLKKVAARYPQVANAGTFDVGQIVYSHDPATSNKMGWICTVAGTPGTWESVAVVS